MNTQNTYLCAQFYIKGQPNGGIILPLGRI